MKKALLISISTGVRANREAVESLASRIIYGIKNNKPIRSSI